MAEPLDDVALDTLLRGLRAKGEPPAHAPPIPRTEEVEAPLAPVLAFPEAPRPRAPSRIGPRTYALAAAALLAVGGGVLAFRGSEPDAPRMVHLRGAAPEGVRAVDLVLVVSAPDGTLTRVGADALPVGSTVFLRVSSAPAGDVRVSVDGPEGSAELATVAGTPDGEVVETADGVLSYRFEATGTYTFTAGSSDGSAPVARSVNVQ